MTLLSRLLARLVPRREEAGPPPAPPPPSPPIFVHAVGDPPPDARGGPVPPRVMDLVAEAEGLRLDAYLCPAGVWTIGHGSTRIYGRAVRQGDRLAGPAEAREMLRRDLVAAAEIVDRAVTVPLTVGERGALISLVHNVGAGRATRPGEPGRDGIVTLASGRPSTLLARLNAGERDNAAGEIPRWNRGGGQVLPGLVRRRAAEMAMFCSN